MNEQTNGSEDSLDQLARLLAALGCPVEKIGEMAAQLDKRATQLAAASGSTKQKEMAHLIGLMKQGWAAKQRGF